MKKYKVMLTADERQSLLDLITAGKVSALKQSHARILLKADAATGGPAWTDDRIAEAAEVNLRTVERVRQRFVEQGLDAALVRLQLLADKLVELGVVDSISGETVRQVLKKTNSSRG
jgi:hypothetical protein